MNKERIEQIMEKVTKRNLANVLCGNKTSEVDNEILELLNEVTRLTNNWNELEECVESRLMSIPDDICTNEVEEARRTTKIAVYQVILGKMKEIKEGKNVSSRN